jgi:hypothetical protein
MAGVTGLEPAASGVTGRRSNRLSYTPLRAVFGQRRQRACTAWDSPSQGKVPYYQTAMPREARKGEAWWAVTGSNCRHPRCKRGALPTELTAQCVA